MAKPVHAVPDGTPHPTFLAVLELSKKDDGGRVVAAVMPSEASNIADPEQRVLAPFYNNGTRALFEFQRAELLIVMADGHVELRVVAVHPVSGAVGTRTKYVFHSRFAKLVARCHAHLAGSLDLFPPQERAPAAVKDFLLPAGQADLDIGRLRDLEVASKVGMDVAGI